MRIGRRRLPRRRDPRRRFRNRLLVGMVGVALLPLVAFAVLAVFELDTIAKSTANATESAILQRQQLLLDRAVDRSAGQLDSGMADIDAAVSGLIGAFAKAKDSIPASATLPAETFSPLGADYQSVSSGGSTLILPVDEAAGKATPDARFVLASENKAFVAQVQAVFKLAAINSVWLEDPSTEAIRAFRAFTPSTTYATHPYDPAIRDRNLNYSEGGTTAAIAPNVWNAPPGADGRSADGPFWSDPYPLLEDASTGVSAWYQVGQAPSTIRIGADVSLGKLMAPLVLSSPATVDPVVVSATGRVVYGVGSKDFPNATVGNQIPRLQPGLRTSLARIETTGLTPPPITTKFNKVTTDLFTAPVYSGHWIVLEPIPVSSLEPNLSALTIGINDSVHRLFPVTVLPVLILLVALAFIATTLLSRRMYLPVRALTDHAVLEERTRLAREIHDTLAQQLTGIVLELEAADALLNRGSEQRARTSVEKARELARGALQEARRSVWNLRPAPLSASGLVAAIGHEVEAWEERTGIPARFKARAVPPHPPLSPTAEVALLRIGQEALSNAARHGHPEHVDVELRAHAQELILSIRDDGIGFDPAASAPREDCFGLDGMAERARNAGGTLTVVSTPGQGTTVTTRLPFTEAVPEAVSA
jgi:signal transduction histidine kinase